MSFSLSSTIPVDTLEEFESSKTIFKRILERQLKEDLDTLIHAEQQVELPWAIGPVAVVNEDTRINLIERIRNSLRWFYHQLFPEPPRQSQLPFPRLLEPIYHPAAGEVDQHRLSGITRNRPPVPVRILPRIYYRMRALHCRL